MPSTAEATLDVLRHLRLNGRQNAKQIKAAVPTLGPSTISNLVHRGHIVSTHLEKGAVEYTISGKGIAKLIGRKNPRRARADEHPSGYSCPELCRNPGIDPARFVAFALPSRIGPKLFWPDGRVTAFTDHPGLPA